jgi:hypothetical protein
MKWCLALAGLLLAVSPCLAWALDPPASPSRDRVAAFSERFEDEPLLVLQDWQGFDVRVRSRDRGLSGEWSTVEEFRIQSRAALEEASVVWITDSPKRRIDDVEVEVIRADGRQKFRRRDLEWAEMTQRSDGVVTLDGTFAMTLVPGLRVGDTVRITRRWDLKGIHGFGGAELGSARRPTLEASLEVWLPEDYRAGWGIQATGVSRPLVVHTEEEHRGRVVNRWILAADRDGSLPICQNEFPAARITPFIEHVGGDHRETMVAGAGWTEVGRAYLQRVEKKFEPSSEIRAEVARTVDGSANSMETIDRIYAAVQRQCRYLGLFEGMGGIIPVAASEVHEDRFGDCKGLGSLLISMLRAAGIEAYPVLLRTRAAGPLDTTAPNMAQFNHFIVWADDGQGGLFLDATVDRYPAGRIPAADTLSPVLLLHPSRIGLVEIAAEQWSAGEVRVEVSGQLAPTGMLELTVQRSYEGGIGTRVRNRFAGMGASDRTRAIAAWALADEPPFQALDAQVRGLEEWRNPVDLEVTATTRAPLPRSTDNILFPRSLSGPLPDFDPAPACERPVDLRLRPMHRETWNIQLPEEFSLDRADTVTVQLDGIRWSRSLWQDGRVLRMERLVEFDPVVVSPEQVEPIREAVSAARMRELGYFALTQSGR